MPQSLRKVLAQKPKHLPKLVGRIQLSDIMDLSEDEFKALIKTIEKTSLFKTLTYPRRVQDKAEKVISFTKYPKTTIANNALELKEEILPDTASVDIETFLQGEENLIKIIRKLGIEKFKEYFLYYQHGLSLEELAKKCDVGIDDVSRIIDLMNEISLQSGAKVSPIAGSTAKVFYSKVAFIEKDKNGFSIRYFDFCYARGKYSIDYEKLMRLKEKKQLGKKQVQEFNTLVKTLEMINARKNILYRILREIIKEQAAFLDTLDFRLRISLAQKEIAQALGVNPSLISRAIRFKSVETSRGEVLLKDFFPDRKTIIKEFLSEILTEKSDEFSDRQLRGLVKKQFNINISRRSINDYRREIISKSRPGIKRENNL